MKALPLLACLALLSPPVCAEPNAYQYQPPRRGAPAQERLVGGGSRGAAGATPFLSTLSPEHVGLTVQAQPTLYWYLEAPAGTALELTLSAVAAPRPLLRLSLPPAPGIHGVALGRHGIRLQPGVAYEWFVALVADPARRSADLVARGAIERVTPPAALAERLARAGRHEQVRLYAEAGYWYDALATLAALIDAAPRDPQLRAERAALLEQVGLPEAAAEDRAAAR